MADDAPLSASASADGPTKAAVAIQMAVAITDLCMALFISIIELSIS
jgi:hypothetical protein